MAEIQHDTSHDGACPLWIEMLVQGELFPVAVSPPGIPAAVSLIRKIGLPRCCGREGWVRRGGKELGGQGRAAWAMWGGWAREAGLARWGGTAAAGQGGAGGWVGGRSDVGLGVDGACRECTRQGAAAGQAEPSSSRNSFLVRTRRAAQGGQPAFESRRKKVCYCGDSNLLELKNYPEPKISS